MRDDIGRGCRLSLGPFLERKVTRNVRIDWMRWEIWEMGMSEQEAWIASTNRNVTGSSLRAV